MVIEETKRFIASCEEPIRSALGLFLWDTEIDLARGNARTFEDFDMMPSFTTKCYEFVMLLGGTGDLDRAAQYVKEHPYLWPSVFMWTMKTQDQRAQIFMKMKIPTVMIPGCASGNMILQNVIIGVQPSIAAASS